MIHINVDNGLEEPLGLGKSKFLRKVTLKGTIKAIKKAAPIAVSLIPVGGGAASKILDSKLGKTALKISKSKAGRAVIKASQSNVGKAVLSQAGVTIPKAVTNTPAPPQTIPVKKKKGFFNKKAVARKPQAVSKNTPAIATNTPVVATKKKFPLKFKKKKTAKTLAIGSKGEEVRELQKQLGVEPDGDFGVKTQKALEQATGQKTINTADLPSQSESVDQEQPQGETIPVKELETQENAREQNNETPGAVPPKNNTLLYVGGGAVLLGAVYLATRKK